MRYTFDLKTNPDVDCWDWRLAISNTSRGQGLTRYCWEWSLAISTASEGLGLTSYCGLRLAVGTVWTGVGCRYCWD